MAPCNYVIVSKCAGAILVFTSKGSGRVFQSLCGTLCSIMAVYFTHKKKRHTGAEVVDIDESETKRQILLVSLGLFFWSEMM